MHLLKILSIASLLTTFLWLSGTAEAQTFDSGSTGADGDLVLTTLGTVVLDPASSRFLTIHHPSKLDAVK